MSEEGSNAVEIVGLQETLRVLRKLDPDLRKEYATEARMILQPAVDEIRNSYPKVLLEGATRKWAPGRVSKKTGKSTSKNIFPYDQKAARRGVGIRVQTGNKWSQAMILIVQRNPAAIVAEFAGKGHPNTLAQALSFKYGRPGRFAWPAIERKKTDVQDNLKKATLGLIARVNKELR